MKTSEIFASSVRNQRLGWTCAIVIGLVLIYRGAPIFPVLLGCVLALLVMGTRAWPFRHGATPRRTR